MQGCGSAGVHGRRQLGKDYTLGNSSKGIPLRKKGEVAQDIGYALASSPSLCAPAGPGVGCKVASPSRWTRGFAEEGHTRRGTARRVHSEGRRCRVQCMEAALQRLHMCLSTFTVEAVSRISAFSVSSSMQICGSRWQWAIGDIIGCHFQNIFKTGKIKIAISKEKKHGINQSIIFDHGT